MKVVVEFVIQEVGGDEGDMWRCRRLFYVVPLKTQNMCCRMNLCLSHVFFKTSKVLTQMTGTSVVFSLLEGEMSLIWYQNDQ